MIFSCVFVMEITQYLKDEGRVLPSRHCTSLANGTRVVGEIYLFNFLVTESRQDKGLQVHSDDSGGTAPSPAEMREGFC
jgi:hypothetical protein